MSQFVICSKENDYKCFTDGCSSNYVFLNVDDKKLNICNLCNGYVSFKDRLLYKCSSDHICCINCFTQISKLLELGCTQKDSIQLLFR